MVGVPRSRGCIGCRQQKKKCEVISEPPCSRCTRLRIPCAGYGERRLKFQDESQNYVVGRGRKKTSAIASSPSTSPQSTNLSRDECYDQDRVVIISNPTNILTTLIASFSHSIDANDQDTRHNLAWNFGGFLYDVPQCLGSNESLDTAADALVAGYIHFRRDRHSKADEVCLQKYSRALRSLRKCLSTEEKACEPATLCAIMIIMVVETLMGVSSEGSLQHAVGAATILKCRGTKPPKNELERKLLMSLRGPVVIQAFYLDESYYTPTEWDRLVSGYSSPEDIDEEGFFDGLAVSCRLFQKTRGALSRESVSQQEIDQLISHVSDLHKSLTDRLLKLSGTLDRTRDFSGSERNIEARLEKFKHGQGVRDYGLTLSTQIVVNCILGALQGMWHESTVRENAWLCREICSLAERDATYHQPLGSAWVLLALPVAYIGAYSDEDKERVLKLLNSYTKDLSSDATHRQTAGLESLFAYLRCSDLPQRTKVATEVAT